MYPVKKNTCITSNESVFLIRRGSLIIKIEGREREREKKVKTEKAAKASMAKKEVGVVKTA